MFLVYALFMFGLAMIRDVSLILPCNLNCQFQFRPFLIYLSGDGINEFQNVNVYLSSECAHICVSVKFSDFWEVLQKDIKWSGQNPLGLKCRRQNRINLVMKFQTLISPRDLRISMVIFRNFLFIKPVLFFLGVTSSRLKCRCLFFNI